MNTGLPGLGNISGADSVAVKKAYQPPTLSDLGAVEQLSLAGAGSTQENSGKDAQPTKRP